MSDKFQEIKDPDELAAISVKLENKNSKLEENIQAKLMKCKRKSKIKMPLKKIPKRNQNSLSERLNPYLCQDMGHFEYPQNISALIVSSVQGSKEGGICLKRTPLVQTTKQLIITDKSNCVQDFIPDNVPLNENAQSGLLENISTTMQKPQQPIVSIARTPLPKEVSNGGNINNQQSEGNIRNCIQSSTHGNILICGHGYISSSNHNQNSPTLKHNDCQRNFEGSSDNKGIYSSNIFLQKNARNISESNTTESMIPFDVSGANVKSSKSSAEIGYKIPKTLDQLELTNRQNDYFNQTSINKSKVSVKPSVQMYKPFIQDINEPLVNIKPPLLTPISPEKKRYNDTRKTQTANETKIVNLELNLEMSEKKSPCCRNNQIKNDQTSKHYCDTEDDDVITDVVNLINLDKSSFLNQRQTIRKRNAKSNNLISKRPTIDLQSFNSAYFENCKKLQQDNSNATNQQKKKLVKRSYTKRAMKNSIVSYDSSNDTDRRRAQDILGNEDNKDDINGLQFIASAAMSKTNFNLIDIERKSTTNLTKARTEPVIPSSLNNKEDEKSRNDRFSTIIDAIKKEEDLNKSSLNLRMKNVISTNNKTDWKSWLNITSKPLIQVKSEVLEIGSGTDSGNKDDLILMRDLSEFLLLSEDRRYLCTTDMNFNRHEINFDNIDSSVNYINGIETESFNHLKDLNSMNLMNIDMGENYKDNRIYSIWQSYFDNFPKYPLQNRLKNRNENYWKRYLLSEYNPILTKTEHHEFNSIIIDKNKCLEEFLSKAGLILRSECADRGIAPSYESKFYRKRIYRKKSSIFDNLQPLSEKYN